MCNVSSFRQIENLLSRVGTKPFMGFDALDSACKENIERFDWESLMWTLVWIICQYRPGSLKIKNVIFKVSRICDLSLIQEKRIAFFFSQP